MEQDVDRQDAENGVFEVGVLVHENGYHSDVRQEAPRSSDDVLFREPKLPGGVKASIVDRVVVTFRQELHCSVGSKTRAKKLQ